MKPKIIIRETDHNSTIIGRAMNILKIFSLEKLTGFLNDIEQKKDLKIILTKYFEVIVKKKK